MMKKLEIILAAMLLPLLSACEKKQVECTYEINIVDDDATRDAVRYLEDLLDEDVFTINAEDEATADAQAQERFEDVLYDVDEEELEALLYPEGSIELVLERIIPTHKEIDSERWRFSEGGTSGRLVLSPNYITLAPGETFYVILTSNGSPVDAASVTWTSHAPDVFSIENGTITAIAEGYGTFTATYNNSSVTGDVEVSEVIPDIPFIEPVAGGITILVCIPEGSDCNGAPLWGGDTNNWSGEEMQAIYGSPYWYKLDVPGVSSLMGKPLAHPEGWTPEAGLGNWPTQIGEWEILQGSEICWWYGDNFEISAPGLVAIWAKSWQYNPCVGNREFTFYIQVPECTPADMTHVNVVGSFVAEDGSIWASGNYYEIIDGIATVTISGQETDMWKVRLTEDWTQQAVECSYVEEFGEVSISTWENKTLGEVEGQVLAVEGWGDVGTAIEGCLTDCVTIY